MATHAHTTSEQSGPTADVIAFPGSGHVPGQINCRATLRRRKDREILLARIEEHRRRIAHSERRISELVAELWELDAYKPLPWAEEP